jgi:hypothetical protein
VLSPRPRNSPRRRRRTRPRRRGGSVGEREPRRLASGSRRRLKINLGRWNDATNENGNVSPARRRGGFFARQLDFTH